MENTKYGKRREGRWTPIRAKAQDTRANPNSWETHLVRKRWDIGLLRAVSLRIMMIMMFNKFCAIDCALGRKIMKDLTGPGRERVDRLPLLVSGQNIVKLLSVPKLHHGTAVTMVNSVVDSMDE